MTLPWWQQSHAMYTGTTFNYAFLTTEKAEHKLWSLPTICILRKYKTSWEITCLLTAVLKIFKKKLKISVLKTNKQNNKKNQTTTKPVIQPPGWYTGTPLQEAAATTQWFPEVFYFVFSTVYFSTQTRMSSDEELNWWISWALAAQVQSKAQKLKGTHCWGPLVQPRLACLFKFVWLGASRQISH